FGDRWDMARPADRHPGARCPPAFDSRDSRMGTRRIAPQITDQAADTNAEPSLRVLQCQSRRCPEQAQGDRGSDAHDPAHPGWNDSLAVSINKLPNQPNVRHVDEEEDGGIKR